MPQLGGIWNMTYKLGWGTLWKLVHPELLKEKERTMAGRGGFTNLSFSLVGEWLRRMAHKGMAYVMNVIIEGGGSGDRGDDRKQGDEPMEEEVPDRGGRWFREDGRVKSNITMK